ncbi:hypothetical protein BRC64_08765 [Halobacteriales archaeon QH_10_67_22]|nr:MAG: hypothetical protein BRC64_08765 [Halobacteriales archaeon QH_10_67_22]
MSHTPLDGSTGGTQNGENSVQRSASAGGLAETVAALGRVVGGATSQATDGDEPGEDDRAASVERPVPVGDDTAGRPAVSERSLPDEAGPGERPELVARWNDDRLTLSEPDEAGAQISSDTWSEVDP